MSIAFIGAGNMAGSLINGLIESGTAPREIAVADPWQLNLKSSRPWGSAQQPVTTPQLRMLTLSYSR